MGLCHQAQPQAHRPTFERTRLKEQARHSQKPRTHNCQRHAGLAGSTRFRPQTRPPSTRKKSVAPTIRSLPHRAVETLCAVGCARRGERHRAVLVRHGDREVRAGSVGQRGRSLDGVAGSLLAGQRPLHLAIVPRGRQARFAARLGLSTRRCATPAPPAHARGTFIRCWSRRRTPVVVRADAERD